MMEKPCGSMNLTSLNRLVFCFMNAAAEARGISNVVFGKQICIAAKLFP